MSTVARAYICHTDGTYSFTPDYDSKRALAEIASALDEKKELTGLVDESIRDGELFYSVKIHGDDDVVWFDFLD
jgi:hypothetical protein